MLPGVRVAVLPGAVGNDRLVEGRGEVQPVVATSGCCTPPFARRPQNAPVSTEPVTFRPPASIEISASSLPFREFDVRKSRFAAWSAGKVNSPTPARVVTARSVFTPLASVTV